MTYFKSLIREPALLIDFFESLIVMLIAVGMFSLHGDQQTYIVSAFIAVLALVKGFLTKPFPVTVVPDLGRAMLVLFASFGVVHLGADQITIIVTFLGTAMTLIMRGQITPRTDPIVVRGGAGAGPVTGDSGFGGLGAIGYVLVVVGVLLLILSVLKVLAISIVICIVLIVIGIIIAVIGGGYGPGYRR